jgi:predicted nucleotidyltransferase
MSISAVVEEATQRLIQAADPLKIVLFGSQGRGDHADGSDLDFLVILPEVKDRRAEMVRLQACLSGLGVPADVLVFSTLQVEKWQDVPGTILYPALREGIVLHDAA